MISIGLDLKKNKEIFYWSTIEEANIGKQEVFQEAIYLPLIHSSQNYQML